VIHHEAGMEWGGPSGNPPEGPRFKSWPRYQIKLKGLRFKAVIPFPLSRVWAIRDLPVVKNFPATMISIASVRGRIGLSIRSPMWV